MAADNLYAGLQDPDCAALQVGGVAYTLTAYAAPVPGDMTIERGGLSVRAQLYAIQEQGQPTMLFDDTVATAAASHVLECVRCVHVADRYFVVYWLDRDISAGTYVLESRYIDVQTFDSAISWTAMSDITPDDAGLFDVKQIENPTSTSEYMLTWATSTSQCVVRRVITNDHTNTPWSTTITTNHADRVLAIHGDGAATSNTGGVAVAYQDGDNDLIVHVLDYSDGTDVGAMTAISGSDEEYTAVGMALTNPPSSPTASRVAVVAERHVPETVTSGSEDSYIRQVVALEVRINASPTILEVRQVTNNLVMLAKPYSYVDAEGDRHVYCCLGYTSIWESNSYRELNGFVCDMGLQHWVNGVSTVRPRPVSTLSQQNIDVRPHAYAPAVSARVANAIGRRTNHLSNWIYGPSWLTDLRKARGVVLTGWGAVKTVEGEVSDGQGGTREGETLSPVNALVKLVWHILEDPWVASRDPEDHAAPTVNFHGDGSRGLHHNVSVQSELLIAGGTPHLYDGRQIVELGFPWSPEIIDVQNSGTGTNIPNGEYRYCAVYEWTDAKGVLHRSGVSNLIPYVSSGTNGSRIVVRTMTISNREADWLYENADPITIAIYRTTLASPNIFRRLRQSVVVDSVATTAPQNDPTVFYIEILDNCVNTVLDNEAPLNIVDGGNAEQYTELPGQTPPASHVVANFQNRVFLFSSEKREAWYSKENLPTAATGRIAPEFSPFLRFTLDTIKGDVVAAQPKDDDLIIFTREGIYALSGFGPDNLGGPPTGAIPSSYTLQVVDEGHGCIEPRSVVLTPMGVCFQAYDGIYLLDKGLGLDKANAGASVEEIVRTSGNVRGATHLSDRNVVAFVGNDDVTDRPIVFKWEYYQKQWSKDVIESPSTTAALSSTAGGCSWRCNERDLSNIVACQGALLIERGKDDATPYADTNDLGNTTAVRMDLETGWISLAGVNGLKRLYEIQSLTELDGVGDDFAAQCHYDVNGTFSLASPQSFDWASPVDATVRLRPRTQKLSSVKLRLYEPDTMSETVGANRTIGPVTFRVGIKKGTRRVSNGQS